MHAGRRRGVVPAEGGEAEVVVFRREPAARERGIEAGLAALGDPQAGLPVRRQRGERKKEKEEKKEGYYRAERSYGAFYRTLPLPEGVKVDAAKAAIKDGVLEVTVPAPRLEEKKRTLVIEEPAPAKTTQAA